mmetsp:Transcript_14749/g.29801  ORF Transcript_14749/g.29801 Transcript_14749/m.29801 type:complete len:280 (+) Transcript_14749:205-1044(+)
MRIAVAALVLVSVGGVAAFAPGSVAGVRPEPLGMSYLDDLDYESGASADAAALPPSAWAPPASAPEAPAALTTLSGAPRSPLNLYTPCTPVGDNAAGLNKAGRVVPAPGREYYGAATDPTARYAPNSRSAAAPMNAVGPASNKQFTYSPSAPIGDNASGWDKPGKSAAAPGREYYGTTTDPNHRAPPSVNSAPELTSAMTPYSAAPSGPSSGNQFTYSPSTPVGDNASGWDKPGKSAPAPGREYFGAVTDPKYRSFQGSSGHGAVNQVPLYSPFKPKYN